MKRSPVIGLCDVPRAAIMAWRPYLCFEEGYPSNFETCGCVCVCFVNSRTKHGNVWYKYIPSLCVHTHIFLQTKYTRWCLSNNLLFNVQKKGGGDKQWSKQIEKKSQFVFVVFQKPRGRCWFRHLRQETGIHHHQRRVNGRIDTYSRCAGVYPVSVSSIMSGMLYYTFREFSIPRTPSRSDRIFFLITAPRLMRHTWKFITVIQATFFVFVGYYHSTSVDSCFFPGHQCILRWNWTSACPNKTNCCPLILYRSWLDPSFPFVCVPI